MNRPSLTVSVLAVGALCCIAAIPVCAAPKKHAAPPHRPSGSASSARPGYFQGRALTTAGKPLAGVEIYVAGVSDAGQNVSVKLHTNAAGVYATRMPAGHYHIYSALYQTSYAGQAYELPLYPISGVNDDADIAEGIVQNLVLKFSGLILPNDDPTSASSYYGGPLTCYDATGMTGVKPLPAAPDGTVFELTLTPSGPLPDGSPGKKVVMTAITHLFLGKPALPHLQDVPIGQYQASARFITPDGQSIPLRLRYSDNHIDFAASVPFVFPPARVSPNLLHGSGVFLTYLYVSG